MKSKAIAAIILGMSIMGCASSRRDIPPGAKEVAPPRHLPLPPRPVPTSIDPSLRGKAKVEINEALSSGDEVFRANAVEAAQTGMGSDAAPVILNAMNDPAWVTRFAATMAAGKLKLVSAMPRLLELASNDSDTNVKVAARYALHRLGDTTRSHDLELFSRDPSSAVRGNTALVLGLLGEKSALKVLAYMTSDRSPIVRLQVAEAEWRLGDERGLEVLVGATVNQDPGDQIFGVLALAEPRDQRVIEHVRGTLTSDYAEVALAAARAMGQLGSDEGYGVALNYARSRDPRQRAMAAWALGDIGRADAQETLGKLLADEDPNVRLAAATAVLVLKSAK